MQLETFERLIMSDSKEHFSESLSKEQLAYGYAGKPKAWQEGFDRGYVGAWQAATEQQQSVIAELVEALEYIKAQTGCSNAESLDAMRNIYEKSSKVLAKVKGVKSE